MRRAGPGGGRDDEAHGDEPRFGLAYGPAAQALSRTHPGVIDYVEVPYEHLRHDPGSLAAIDAPVVLHCASMSIAGFVPPDDHTLSDIATWAARVGTPWIGEHLAFILADDPDALTHGHEVEPTRLTYTMSPQLSERVLDRVGENLARLRPRFDHEIILENSPHYVDVPGSEISYVGFVAEVADRFDVGLLLDLTHLAVSAHNLGFDAADALAALPLERVVEIHVSGLSVQDGVAWDDHASLAPPAVIDLLRSALVDAAPRAVTFEYNWAPDHDLDAVATQIEAVRSIVGRGVAGVG
jgi:uncharacterized protein